MGHHFDVTASCVGLVEWVEWMEWMSMSMWTSWVSMRMMGLQLSKWQQMKCVSGRDGWKPGPGIRMNCKGSCVWRRRAGRRQSKAARSTGNTGPGSVTGTLTAATVKTDRVWRGVKSWESGSSSSPIVSDHVRLYRNVLRHSPTSFQGYQTRNKQN